MTQTPPAHLVDHQTVDALSPAGALRRAVRGAGAGALLGGLVGARAGLPGLVICTAVGAGIGWALGPLLAGASLTRRD